MVTFKKRLKKVRQKIEEKNLHAVLFTHRPNVLYLSGFTGTSGFLLVTRDEAQLYTDFRYLQQAREQADGFEIVKVESASGYAEAVQYALQKGLINIGLEDAHITLREYNQLLNTHPAARFIPVQNFLEEIRILKDEEEVQLIASAARIADGAFRDLLPLIKPGISELDVAAELEYRLRKGGSEKLPFEIIIASGERSALPHGVASQRIINEGELIIVDFGAVFGGYCSDMTRTFILGGATAKQQEVYDLVLQGQEMALKALKPGQRAADADAMVRQFFSSQGFGEYFGHGLGHGVGLEVHELPTLSPKGQLVLQETMVFTIEPGIYIDGWGGVRIEDLVVLRPDGVQVLTNTGKKFVV